MWRMKYTILRNLGRLPGLMQTMHRIRDRTDLYTEQDAYDFARYIVGLMRKTGWIKTEGYGMEQLPGEGGYLLCPNHMGKYDAYGIVSVHERPLSVVMDRDMSYFTFVDELLELLRGKRMDIQNSRQALGIIRQIADEVAQGRRYIIFPEGGYSNDKGHRLWDFRPGCFKAATRVEAPIVPVALVDSHLVYNSWKLTPVRTQVHFLQPLYAGDYRGMTTAQIGEVVRSRIVDKLRELGRG